MIAPSPTPISVMPPSVTRARRSFWSRFMGGKSRGKRRKQSQTTATPLMTLRWDTEAWARYQTREQELI